MSPENTANVEKYHFRLYIDSAKPNSHDVADRLHKICRLHLFNNYTLELIDLQESPGLFDQRRIIAVPTLDIETPELHHHRFVGNLSQSEIFITAAGMTQEATKMAKQAAEIRNRINKPQS
ncbi:MAG: circadian clock KaiB family protein [Candidatus Thiodiazotropha sp.]